MEDNRWEPYHWERAVEEALIVVEDCIGENDKPKELVNRLINGHCRLNEEYWVSGISHLLTSYQYYGMSAETGLKYLSEMWEKRVNG